MTTVDGVTGTYTSGYSDSKCQSFLGRTSSADLTDWSPSGSCDSSCTQVTTGVCSGTFLASVLVGDGVKYAYCNDKWLVFQASGAALRQHAPGCPVCVCVVWPKFCGHCLSRGGRPIRKRPKDASAPPLFTLTVPC